MGAVSRAKSRSNIGHCPVQHNPLRWYDPLTPTPLPQGGEERTSLGIRGSDGMHSITFTGGYYEEREVHICVIHR
jgi:hypothetical protein